MMIQRVQPQKMPPDVGSIFLGASDDGALIARNNRSDLRRSAAKNRTRYCNRFLGREIFLGMGSMANKNRLAIDILIFGY